MGGSILDVASKVLGKKSRDEFHRGMAEIERKIILKVFIHYHFIIMLSFSMKYNVYKKKKKYLKKTKIRVIHRGQRKTVYRVKGITAESADRTFFSLGKDNRKITVAEYFHRAYGRRLEFEALPCIIVNNEDLMPMEVCEILEGNDYKIGISSAPIHDTRR